jgi:uncharacterized repeat protein (TIGR02543 family)
MGKCNNHRISRWLVVGILTAALVLALPLGVTGLFAKADPDSTGGSTVLASMLNLYDVNAYAASKVKIKFDANGGTIGTKITKTKSVRKNKKIGKLPTAARTGYVFKGWFTKKSGGKKISKNTRAKRSTTYYAQWARGRYTIIFDANGGTASFSSKSVKYGTMVGTLPSGTKPEYTLAGWYTAPEGGTKYAEDTVYSIQSGITLYAHWVLKDRAPLSPYTVDEPYVLPVFDKREYESNGWASGNIYDNQYSLRTANLYNNCYSRGYHRLKTGDYITYLLDCKYTDLQGVYFLGWEDRTTTYRVWLKIYRDNVLAYTSPVLTKDVAPIAFTLDVRNVERLKLEVVSDNVEWLPQFGITASLGQL